MKTQDTSYADARATRRTTSGRSRWSGLVDEAIQKAKAKLSKAESLDDSATRKKPSEPAKEPA